MNNLYVLVEWPESQDFMEEPWFQEEAVLHPELSAAYFIPEHRIITRSYISESKEKYLHDDFPFEGGF